MRSFIYLYTVLILCPAFSRGANIANTLDLDFVKELPSLQVLALLQDSRGYLWIGTENGLFRFDGYNTKQFLHNPGDTNTISDDWINCLEEDENGLIWVGTENGLDIYSYLSDRFKHHYSSSDSQAPLGTSSILCIAKNNGAIWIGTDGEGLFDIVPSKQLNEFNEPTRYYITHFIYNESDKNSLPGQTVYSICFDKFGRGWFGTNAGLAINIDSATNTSFVTLHHTFNKNSITSDQVFGVHYDAVRNSIWAISIGMVDKITVPSPALDTTGLIAIHFCDAIRNVTGSTNSQFMSFIVGANETYWIAILGYGLLEFKLKAELNTGNLIGNYKKYKVNGSFGFYIIYQRDPSTTWFGASNGVSKLLTEPQVFQPLTNGNFTKRDDLSCFYKDIQGNLWLGTIHNKIILISDSGKMKYLDLPITRAKKGINNIVYCIIRNGTGDVLIGATNGLYVIEGREVEKLKTSSAKFMSLEHPFGNASSNSAVLCFAIDSGRSIWIGTDKGLYYYQPENRTVHPALGLGTDLTISSIAVQGQKRIWIATQNGLHLYNPVTMHDSLFTTGNSLNKGFISNEIQSLALNKNKKQLWVATDNGVLIHTDSNEMFKPISLNNRFVRGQVSDLVCDINNILWFVTTDGLVMYNPAENRMKYFNKGYEPFKRGVTDCELYNDASGHILVGNANGIFSVNPAMMVPSSAYQTVITDLKVMGSSIFIDSSARNGVDFRLHNDLTVHPGQTQFSVEFTEPDFISPDKIEYAYRFGNDTGWNYIGNTHFVSCSVMNSGTFTFSVKATNEDGVWSESPTSFSVYVIPPFYKTGLFYSLIAVGCVLIIGLIFYAFYRVRLQRILVSQRIRNKIAGDLHDDIGSTLNSISLYSEIARQQAEREFPTAIPFFQKIGEDSRSIISTMSDIVWMINPKNDSMEILLQRMENFAAQLLGPKSIAFRFNCSDKVRKMKPPMEARRNLFLVFKEALNNSVKYSECKAIKVNLLEHHGRLHLFISDDGKGFNVACDYSGNGLHNFRVRAKEIGGTIDIQSTPGNGTTIHLQFKST